MHLLLLKTVCLWLVKLEDKFENMGAQMVKEVASKANDAAGDGTTTATVLAQAIVVSLKAVATAR